MHKKAHKPEEKDNNCCCSSTDKDTGACCPPNTDPVPASDDRIKGLEDELKKEKDSYLRLRAEFDNYRKRMAQEKEDFAQYAASAVLLELLPIVDNFERAQHSFEKHKDDTDEIIKGVALIHKQMEDLLKKTGVEPIECQGKPFDPVTMEAIMQKEVTEGEDTIVLEVVQQGYRVKDKLLRHAMVVVSKKKST